MNRKQERIYMKAKLHKIGGSVMVRIPHGICQLLDINETSKIELDLTKSEGKAFITLWKVDEE